MRQWINLVAMGVASSVLFVAQQAQGQRISQPAGDLPTARQPEQATAAPGQPGSPQNAQERITESLKKIYPDRQVRLGTPHTVNGVEVYDATLEGSGGTATAKVTEFGDILVANDGTQLKFVAPPVAQTLRGLFQKPNEDMQVVHTTRYLVDVRINNKPWQLVLDPTGQLADIRSEAAMKEADQLDFPQANEEQRRGVQPVAEKYIPGAKIDRVYQFPEAPNFFVVELNTPDKRRARLVMHGAKEVTVARQQLPAEQLPPPVRDAVQRMFSSPIERVMRYDSKSYQVVQPTAQNTQVVVQVTPSGRIVHVSNPAVQQIEREAVPAGQRQEPGK